VRLLLARDFFLVANITYWKGERMLFLYNKDSIKGGESSIERTIYDSALS